jgi:hypothetical protein
VPIATGWTNNRVSSPGYKVTAPEEVPVLMIDQSKQPLIGIAGAVMPASVRVPVGRVRLIAAVPDVVMSAVSSSAMVKVAEAALADGSGLDPEDLSLQSRRVALAVTVARKAFEAGAVAKVKVTVFASVATQSHRMPSLRRNFPTATVTSCVPRL